MFNFFKKSNNLVSPISGEIVDLSQVPDPVFAEKMTGDGVAINPTGNIIVAPADCIVSLIFGTKHAIGLTTDTGLELLIHFGLETVTLNGEGFEPLVEQGQKVKVGTPLMKVDTDLIASKGLKLITPFLITNVDAVKSFNVKTDIKAEAGKDVVITYKK
ncbi:MAG: PTS glucose transporter subunit IIA [Clostridiaceae bacterium]